MIRPRSHSFPFIHPEKGLVFHQVSKRFGRVKALEEVSFTAGPSEFLVIIGPTGCGKTTLLRLIAGLEVPDTGQIYIHGRCVNDIKPKDRGVRMVFQDHALWPHMPVFNKEKNSNLSFGMRIRQHLATKIQSSVNIISKRLGIEKELFPRTPDQLSGGQKQVVGIGRAMTILPKVLLLDEPLAHVDPQRRLQLRRELKEYQRSMDIMTLYVTHNLPDAFSVADRLAIMNEGKIVQIATPQEIRENPIDGFVKDFVDCFEM